MDTEDKVKNKAAQVGGKAKEAVGKLTDNDQMEAEGRLQHDKATLAADAEKLKKNIKDAAEHIKDAFKE
jgi:uncharacterized protein YjbJ (UPF0337 family)